MPVPATQLIAEGFGVADGSKTYPIPVASQIGIVNGAASFTDGFPPLTRTQISAGGIPPNGEDVNGILYMATANLALLCSGQYPGFDAAQATAIGGYAVGAMVERADGTGTWINTVNANTTNPDNDAPVSNGWVPGYNYGVGAVNFAPGGVNVPLGMGPASKQIIVIQGALTSTLQVMFPHLIGAWIIVNSTTGGQTVNVTMAGSSSAITIPAGGYAQPYGVIGDGVNLYPNTVSTAGLAPLANPVLTGTPQAPTAPGGSNTTQIATTQFTQGAIAAGIAGLAPLASPTFSGSPTVPTPAPGSNNALIADTAFVQAAIAAADFAPINSPSFTGAPRAPTQASTDNSTLLATTAFVQAAAGGSVIRATNGRVVMPGGLILQWGQTPSSGGGEIQNQTSSLPFANPTATLFVTMIADGGTPVFVQSWTASTFTWGTGYTGGRATTKNYVFAIGY
jgi:hypothetical protein